MTTTIQGTVTALGSEPDVHARIRITGGTVSNGSNTATITGGEMIIALDSAQGVGDLEFGSSVQMTVYKYVVPAVVAEPDASTSVVPPAAEAAPAAASNDGWAATPPTSESPAPTDPPQDPAPAPTAG